jgi:hypothetical protein
MKTDLRKILEFVDSQIEQPLVDARFGDQWKEHQVKIWTAGQITVIDLIGIAWKQGRRAILLEREVYQLLKQNERLKAAIDTMQKNDDEADDGDF